MYYVYALLDPRRPGPFKYGNWKFDFEPFYVGKGKDNRAFKHLDHTLGNCGNLHKIRKIAKIRRETDEEPVVLIKRKGLSEAEALVLETKLIALIGRSDKKLGPLTNLTDGGEGTSNREYSKKTRNKLSKSTVAYFASLTPEDRASRWKNNRKTAADYKAELLKHQPNISAKSEYEGVDIQLTFKCKVCKHTWTCKPMYCISRGCPACRRNDPVHKEQERLRRSAAVKAVHESRSNADKQKIARKIGHAQKSAWESGKHEALHYSKARKDSIRAKRSSALKAYCAANPDKKRQAAIKSHATRKQL